MQQIHRLTDPSKTGLHAFRDDSESLLDALLNRTDLPINFSRKNSISETSFTSSISDRVSEITSSVKSIDCTDEVNESILTESRKNNWYVYASLGALGMIGIAAIVTGIFFGYTWIGFFVGGALFVASAYGIKRIDDEIKKDIDFQTASPIQEDLENGKEPDFIDPFFCPKKTNGSLLDTRYSRKVITSQPFQMPETPNQMPRTPKKIHPLVG